MIWKIRKHFSCAHFYNQSQWSLEKNAQEFGKCFTQFGHGHDYTWEIEFSANSTSARTQVLKVVEELTQKLDHQHLNFTFAEFQKQIPTTENLALFLKKELQSRIDSAETQILKMRLLETPQIWVEF